MAAQRSAQLSSLHGRLSRGEERAASRSVVSSITASSAALWAAELDKKALNLHSCEVHRDHIGQISLLRCINKEKIQYVILSERDIFTWYSAGFFKRSVVNSHYITALAFSPDSSCKSRVNTSQHHIVTQHQRTSCQIKRK